MATVSTPQVAYSGVNPIPGTACGRSVNLTVALSVIGFEAIVPFQGIQPGTASNAAGWEAYAYRSSDGGNTYETVASVAFSIAISSAANDRKTMTLGPGYWLLRLISGGSTASTFSFMVGTYEQISCILNT